MMPQVFVVYNILTALTVRRVRLLLDAAYISGRPVGRTF